ncbi:MAG: thiaminase II [Deltaproteobacteria bacterium]|nr:thiaminase II [Deltaproteobacteria bacterium]MBI3076856.1 thiaminase II [Deltaproteobacteria bacterium]
MAGYRDRLREPATTIWEATFAHPFLRELGAGTLSRERFVYFFRQDYLYLVDFARALCLGGMKADTMETLEMFARHAATAIQVEQQLHAGFAKRLGLSEEELRATPPGPVTKAYTTHLVATAQTGTLAEIVACVLPCYWIYWEVGKRLQQCTPQDPLYVDWIATYGGEEYGAVVEEQLKTVDRLGPSATPSEQTRMQQHFLLSSRYEYLFWEQAYRLEAWPI